MPWGFLFFLSWFVARKPRDVANSIGDWMLGIRCRGSLWDCSVWVPFKGRGFGLPWCAGAAGEIHPSCEEQWGKPRRAVPLKSPSENRQQPPKLSQRSEKPLQLWFTWLSTNFLYFQIFFFFFAISASFFYSFFLLHIIKCCQCERIWWE